MSKVKPNVFKGRTKEWNPNDYQGRSRQQVETNEKISGYSILAVVIFLFGYAIYNLIWV